MAVCGSLKAGYIMKTNKGIISKVKKVIKAHSDAVVFAFLFGSFARGGQTPLSDIDLAVYFQDISEDDKIAIEQEIFLLFDEPVHILRLEDDEISQAVRLEAVFGIPIFVSDIDKLNDFVLSIIHRAHEDRYILERLKRVA